MSTGAVAWRGGRSEWAPARFAPHAGARGRDASSVPRRLSADDLDALHREMYAELMRDAEWSVSRTDAEDLVADTFATLWRRRDELELTHGGYRAWMYVALRNGVRHFRSREAEHSEKRALAACQEVVGHVPPPGDALMVRESVEERLGVLSESQAQVLRLTILEGYSAREVGEVLGIPASTVRSRASRALERLAREIPEAEARWRW